MKIEPLTPAIGAQILDVDLGQLSPDLLSDVRAALLQYKVVFFRGQNITSEQHIAFARGFGALEIHPATPKDQPNPELLHITHGPDSRLDRQSSRPEGAQLAADHLHSRCQPTGHVGSHSPVHGRHRR